MNASNKIHLSTEVLSTYSNDIFTGSSNSNKYVENLIEWQKYIPYNSSIPGESKSVHMNE